MKCKNTDEFIKSDPPQLAVFDHVRHFETWGGDVSSSGLASLLEVLGHNLLTLHLCHVEEISSDSLAHLSQKCRYLHLHNRQQLSLIISCF